MSLGLFEDRNRKRRRRQVVGFLVRWTLVILVGVGVGFWAYDIGSEIAREDVRNLDDRLQTANDEVMRLNSEVAGLNAALRTERDRVAEWQQRYDADVPDEAEQALLTAARERADAGVPLERLAEVVRLARDDVDCEPLGETKRFVVKNPIYQGSNDFVTFANGAVTITAEGEPAQTADGRPQAWFDTSKPIRARFAHVGGETAEVDGQLPIHHAVVAGQREYRFSLVEGPRSFIQVTGEVCPYP